ncbi:MAG: hypothetical protein HYZ25_13295 [Chloroflexi bacterium]|nr:hypothetical protein [Chloroflexota bacterium]
MRHNKKKVITYLILFAIFMLTVCVYGLPFFIEIYNDIKAYETRASYRDNYKLHTTPLAQDTILDICTKLKISNKSKSCVAGATVYAPELFDEIKEYFKGLPKQNKTFDTVREYLGNYLVECEKPDPDGYYRCKYDLRGDKMYPIFFLFDKNNSYYEIIANIGGS